MCRWVSADCCCPWVKAALAANDRLKLYLTVVQAAASHADHPQQDAPDLTRELAAAGIASAPWLLELAGGASRVNGVLLVPDLKRLVASLEEDLAVMARPVLEFAASDAEPHLRVQHWLDWLAALKGEQLDKSSLNSLTRGKRETGHMAWLKAGGEQLVYSAMQAAGEGAFRIGDRLDQVLGEANAQAFLIDVMGLASQALLHGHDELATRLPEAWQALQDACRLLEQTFADMQDFEFTVQDGRLYMLQTRNGKRTPQARARIALDMLDEGLINAAEAPAHRRPGRRRAGPYARGIHRRPAAQTPGPCGHG